MSRVRILNLPRDCTEDQLRRHLLASLPPSAPHVEITDCVIKRPSAPGRSVIRMAFVGFRNAASGHFVVRHFDQTYFGSAKLRVEVAKGLGEVGVTTNMRKKMEAAEGRARRQAGAEVNNEEAGGKRGRGAGTMKRGRDAMQNTSCLQSHEEEGGGEAAEAELQKTKKKRQKDEFIAERTKATSGPTWASEVLVPETAEPNTEALISGTHMDVNNNNNNNNEEEEEEAKDEEEAERYALERQQALGEVSDLDFLASLANNTTAASSKQGVTTGKKEEKEKEKEGKGMKGADGEELPQSSEAVSPIKDSQELIVRESRRIRLGNIPYIATEDDVKQFASSLVGSVEAVHIPLTKDTRQSKGAAFVKFIHTADAVRALSLCHGAVFMGRLLRVSAAEDDPYTQKAKGNNDNGGGMAGNSEFKRQKENDRRNENGSTMTWNTMYMNSHAAVESVAKRLGVTPEAVVSVQARGAAVRAAIAEAYLTTEIQQVLSDEGIDFGLLESAQQNILKTRSNTTILVKNIQGMDSDDAAQLSKMFLRYGTLEATAFPSAGGFALFRYTHQQDARVAFQRLSYKLFKNSPLFLEWAPIGAIVTQDDDNDNNNNNNNDNNNKGENKAAGDDNDEDDVLGNNAVLAPVFTLFITNIPFTSTEEEFNIFLLDTCTRLSKTPEKYIERLAFEQDKGRAFLTVKDQSTFNYVQQRLNGRSFAKRTLACVPSKQTVTMLNAKTAAAPLSSKGTVGSVPTHMGEKKNEKEDDDEEVAKTSAIVARRGAAAARHGDSRVPSGCDPLKLVVKNVPFEATERDIRDLFSAFSEIRSVRLPRKSHQFSSHRENNHRGFAFVEFLSEGEAGRAMETLRATHLYGRHLVLQYAKLDG